MVAFTFGFFPRRIIKERRVGNCEKISTYRQFLCFSHAQLNSTCLDGWIIGEGGRSTWQTHHPKLLDNPPEKRDMKKMQAFQGKSFGIEISMTRWSKQKDVDIFYHCIACFSCRQKPSGIKKRREGEPEASCLANKLYPWKPLKHPSFLKFLTI